uniref:Uncharacterized protein n=1 Tax=Photorhabdus asymbiotica subsp. asymbiotica TaxID=171440 RepID=B0JD05_9GAMM|nr:hypothetical protein [Photorhabdus asymbiotica subsp. asymbiotica]
MRTDWRLLLPGQKHYYSRRAPLGVEYSGGRVNISDNAIGDWKIK